MKHICKKPFFAAFVLVLGILLAVFSLPRQAQGYWVGCWYPDIVACTDECGNTVSFGTICIPGVSNCISNDCPGGTTPTPIEL